MATDGKSVPVLFLYTRLTDQGLPIFPCDCILDDLNNNIGLKWSSKATTLVELAPFIDQKRTKNKIIVGLIISEMTPNGFKGQLVWNKALKSELILETMKRMGAPPMAQASFYIATYAGKGEVPSYLEY